MMLTTALFTVLAALASPAPAPACTAVTTPFIGTICAPASGGPHRAIVLLGGSEGGDSMARAAARFAQRGVVAASVAYFGAPGQPTALQNIPVEPVGAAADTLAKRADVDASHIAILGISKGGELALLAASIYPQFHAVVAVVPSPFAWQGISAGGTAESSWSQGGKPVTYVPFDGPAFAQAFSDAYRSQKPLALRPAYDASTKEFANKIPAAMFHLENIHGPVFFLAAASDQLWDSPGQSRLGLDYLTAHHHPFADKAVTLPDAGHAFLFATPDYAMTSVPFGGVTLDLGGTPAGNVAAANTAWAQIGEFLSAP